MNVKLTALTLVSIIGCFFFSLDSYSCNSTGVQIVTNTTDEGPGSLREAIDCANNQPGADTIRFNLTGPGPHLIYVGSTTGAALPALVDEGIVIDGSTQPGYIQGNSPQIILDGGQTSWNSPINALWIRANRCEVYGLEVRNFPDDGIDIRAANEVQIGALGKGNVIYNNGWALDYFPGAPGTGPWEGCGIVLRRGASNCRIFSNVIGTDHSQTLDLGNEYCGIIIADGGDGHLIGGAVPGEGNVIAHNAAGVRVGTGSTDCSLIQNHLFCNDSLALYLRPGANNNQSSPVITEATPSQITGEAADGELIQVFVNDPSACSGAVCQGRFYLGSTFATVGEWSLGEPYDLGYVLTGGEIVTAVATSTSGSSSEYANCKVVSGSSSCTDSNGIIWVSNTDDEGPGTLRSAIQCANATPGGNTIRFNIPGNGPHTIAVGSTTGAPLPALTDVSTILDATTQAGYGLNNNFNPQILLEGRSYAWTAPINAIWVRADYCEVYGLAITGFPDDAIDITGANYVTIGGVNKGNVIYDNGYDQDYFPDAPNTGPWNGCGIVMKNGSHHCIIQGNILGTNYLQNEVAPNELCGIVIQDGGDLHLIGGTEPGEGNLIAHHEEGIRVSSSSYGCSIWQNQFDCNILPINLTGNANFALVAPEVDSASTIFVGGTGATTDQVDVYLQSSTSCSLSVCQGASWLGRAEVINGRWALPAPFTANLQPTEGELVTALATDTLGNTSVFSTCIEMVRGCALIAEVDQLVMASCDQDNGSFEILVSGGIAPLSFMLNGVAQTSAIMNGLGAGNYTVIATDAGACADTLTVQITNSGVPSLNILNQSSTNCGIPNGSIEAEVMGGQAPYVYDIGNGPTSSGLFTGLSAGSYQLTLTDATTCTATLDFQIDDTGAPFLSVNNIQHASCGQSDGSFSVTAAGGQLPFTFDIGNGPTSDTLFDNLASGMYTVTLSDANSCVTTTSVIISDQVIMPQAGFSFSPDADTVHFNNLSQDGNSYNWNFGDGTGAFDSNPSHLYDRNDQFTVCLTATNACGDDTYCETINVVFPLRVGGTIWREDGVGVSNTLLSSGGLALMNAVDGTYLLSDLPPGADYIINSEKDINWGNGLTTFDTYLIQQHILDVSALGSPYKMIAADANGSGTITTFDIYRLRQLILGVEDDVPGNTSWRFVPADYVFSNPGNPFLDNFPEQIELDALDRHQLTEDFIAIKIGDVNLSNNPLAFQRPQEEMNIRLDADYPADEETLLLNFRAKDFEALVGLQFDLQFDPEQLHFQGLSAVGLDGFDESHLGSHHAVDGQIAIAWNEGKGRTEGCRMEEGALLFQLRFELKQPVQKLEEVFQINRNRSIAQAFRYTGEARALQFEFEEADLKTEVEPLANLQLLANSPNPFRKQTQIRYYLPDSDGVMISLTDLTGKVLLREERRQTIGWQEKTIDAEVLGLAAGLYIFHLQTQHEQAAIKLLVKK